MTTTCRCPSSAPSSLPDPMRALVVARPHVRCGGSAPQVWAAQEARALAGGLAVMARSAEAEGLAESSFTDTASALRP